MKKSKQLIKIPHFARTMGKDIIPDPMAVPESTNRKIIAYCENATVFSRPQSGEEKGRYFKDKDGTKCCASYSIVSDNLINLESLEYPFIINTAKYNPYMFRGQRSFLSKYPQLKEEILSYIHDLEIYNYQNQIHSTLAATTEYAQKLSLYWRTGK